MRQSGGGVRAWVDSNSKRYIPCVEDMVIGVVTDKHGEEYRLDIRSCSSGLLPVLAFEGATKRSRPRLEVGALVYCRVTSALKDMEPELSCVSLTSNKGWMTGGAVFGELSGGHMFETSIGYARSLLLPDCPVVNCLGQHVPFEMAASANGRVWVKSDSVAKTVLLVNAILNAEYLPPPQVEALVLGWSTTSSSSPPPPPRRAPPPSHPRATPERQHGLS
eukprot:CAMPEP_0172180550 /NCGR_PEP_ID=MMETSP1050-20130122/17298_1 /TAXON_ID=233186 /ORGANISM="Cryptomonas curvata, Strain CCAP979/52" /LENGTH=219 /DNA_ID=CAMNT_0012853681 /DNA_START=208 /DNA_END=865 /DNA_ORIENTATION=+